MADSTGTAGPTAPHRQGVRRGVSTKGLIWAAAGLALLVVLVTSGRITSLQVVVFCTIVPSIILHEISHGVVALACGDDTAKRAGRLTLNPIRHIDPFGTIILPALMIITTGGFFGWAKPVPVNLGKLRSPRNQGVLVALAGPGTNLCLAALAAALFRVFGGEAAIAPTGNLPIWAEILVYGGLVNVWLAVFNMIPIPPLDGSAVFERCLPRSWWPGYLRIRPYTMPILVGLVLLTYVAQLPWLADLENTSANWWARILGI